MNYATMTLDELEQRARDTGNALALACILRANETETKLKDQLEADLHARDIAAIRLREECAESDRRITELKGKVDDYLARITKLRKALSKIINCNLADTTKYIQKVDSLAIDAIHYDDIDEES